MNKGKIIIRSSQIVKIAIVFFLIFLLVLQSGCTSAKNKTSSPSSPKKELEKKSTVHDITKDEVYDKYLEATEFINKKYLFQYDYVDSNDTFKNSNGENYYRYIGDEFKSVEDVKAKLREYFTSDFVKEYENGDYKDIYIEKDGKLYYREPRGAGLLGQYKVDVERDANDKFSIYHIFYPTVMEDEGWHNGVPELDYVSEGKFKESLVHCVKTKDGWKFDNVVPLGVTGRIKEEFAQFSEKDKKPYKDILSKLAGYVDNPESIPENDYRIQRIKRYLLSDILFGIPSYSLTDINDDGIKELIINQSSYEEGSEFGGTFIIAMYTLVSGKPELVRTSTTDHDERYSIMEGGLIHYFSASDIEALYKLKPNSKEFETIDIAHRFEGESLQERGALGEFQTFKCRPIGL